MNNPKHSLKKENLKTLFSPFLLFVREHLLTTLAAHHTVLLLLTELGGRKLLLLLLDNLVNQLAYTSIT